MRCPTCGDDYRSGVLLCADCGVALVPESFEAVPDLLGRFHPLAARLVVRFAEDRGSTARTIPRDDATDVLVDHGDGDPLRGELVVAWDELLQALDVDERAELLTSGGPMPGWIDPPGGVWVDREGRLQAAHDDPEGRALGPVLVTLGILLLIAAWYAGEGTLVLLGVIGGLGLLLVGVFSPR